MPSVCKRALIVDDYPDAAELSCMLLGMLGHDCRSANSGLASLAVAVELQPEIVILDIGLPDISGYEVARTLRQRAGDQPLFIAAVTGWGQPADRVRASEAGFDHHVLKPADRPKLEAIVAAATTSAEADRP